MHMPRLRLLAPFALILPFFSPTPALAGECWSEPYREASGSATVKSAVFMRTGPCQEGTTVLATAPATATVTVLAEDHEWYLIRLQSGATGWVWNSFLTLGPVTLTDSDRTSVEAKFPVTGSAATPAPTPTAAPTPAPVMSGSLTTRMKGRILLQVQSHGEAWYVDPVSAARYYLKDGPTAYEALRKFGLGVTEADYATLQSPSSAAAKRLAGRIVLRVQAHGEAYYVHPDTRELHYLKDGPAAYSVMRFLSLGITTADLETIPAKEIALPAVSPAPGTETPIVAPVSSVTPTALTVSPAQYLPLPDAIDVLELNRYWLDKVNALRAEKGLRQLVLDQRWLDTSAEWSAVAADRGAISHTRDDGKTMHQWIDAKGLPFTVRYGADGWKTNYFTENISWGHVGSSMDSAERALDDTLAMYLKEGPTGAHYKTVYHADWNSVGAGFAFVPDGNGYAFYQTFHYGSLKNAGE